MFWFFLTIELLLVCVELYLVYKEHLILALILPMIAIVILLLSPQYGFYSPIILPTISFFAIFISFATQGIRQRRRERKAQK